MTRNAVDIAFLGFGEAGQAFWSGLSQARPDLKGAAFDIKTEHPDMAEAKLAEFDTAGVEGLASALNIAGAEIIFSTVTADQAGNAAEMAAIADLDGALFLDCNSCAPGTKVNSAKVIEAAGGRYVDMAVMAPVYPKRHQTPCQISGPHAALAAEALARLDMDITIAEGPVGTASTRKMLRSVIMKGMEALVLECVLAARKAGVEDAVLGSLDATFPGFGWHERGAYMMERVTTHGKRRAAEMREVALTVEQLGFEPHMARSIVEWQQTIGDLGLPPGDNDIKARADAILGALGDPD